MVLRCPYTRVASSFLNRIVDEEFIFYDDAAMTNRVSINFHDFLSIIKSQDRSERDQHWRNQSDFLHYERYDEYFSLESFSEAINSLGARGFTVHDTRAALKHD